MIEARLTRQPVDSMPSISARDGWVRAIRTFRERAVRVDREAGCGTIRSIAGHAGGAEPDMYIQCARCKTFVCRVGRSDAAPEHCPMRGDMPDVSSLYTDAERLRLAQQSAAVEGLGYGRWTRLREVAELAQRMGYGRIGVGYCPDMVREAVLTALFLRDYQFSVRLPPEPLDCDPFGQAALFAEQGTQLNVVAGMCVGHEAVFIRASQAPVTVLVARDARLHHNPSAALYTAETYSHVGLYGEDRRCERLPYRGTSTGRMLAAARKLLPDRHEPWCRVRETMEFLRLLGIDHVGISFCVGFRQEARTLSRVLEANGFRVSEVQAELLNRAGVQFALVLGQCVGHDAATLARLEVPGVCIVAKDRVLGHNTVAALYALEG